MTKLEELRALGAQQRAAKNAKNVLLDKLAELEPQMSENQALRFRLCKGWLEKTGKYLGGIEKLYEEMTEGK